MQHLSPGGQISITSLFDLGEGQQWNFPSHMGTLYLYLKVTSESTLGGYDQFKPAQASLV